MTRTGRPAETVALAQPDRDTLAVTGGLTFATAGNAFREGIRLLTDGAQTRLDLAGLTRADSAGLACVLALAAAASRAGRRMEVVHWPEGLRSLASVCGVERLLDPAATA